MSELLKKLETYADSDYLPMHMPGHKRRMGDLGNPFFIDVTEIDGFLPQSPAVRQQAERFCLQETAINRPIMQCF